jgi:hypothetical protein
MPRKYCYHCGHRIWDWQEAYFAIEGMRLTTYISDKMGGKLPDSWICPKCHKKGRGEITDMKEVMNFYQEGD